MANERVRRAVRDALNGDYENVDPALRRALFAISTELDEHSLESSNEHKEIRAEVKGVRRLLISTTVTFVIAMGTSLLNLIMN